MQPVTRTQYAEATGRPRTTERDILRGLIERGHVREYPNPRDGRSTLLELTPEGQAIFDGASPPSSGRSTGSTPRSRGAPRARGSRAPRPARGAGAGGGGRDGGDVAWSVQGEDRRETDSGIEIKPVYTAEDVAGLEPEPPGELPLHARAVPGHVPGAAVDDPAVRGLRVGRGDERALPLPARPRADRALGRVRPPDAARLRLGRPARARRGGADRRRDRLDRGHGVLFDGIPLDDRLDVDDDQRAGGAAPAPLRARRRGPGRRRRRSCAARCRTTSSRSTCARGNYIYPPRPSMRITTDLFAYCAERLPNWNTISISGYHIREAGATAVQELAFTLANGIAYCQAAVDAGLSLDDFGARLSFFFNAHNHFFQEVAKFRAARRLWAEIMRERFGATNPKAQALRFHAQTGGSTLTAQQPENNVVRVAVQALAAVCGGAQSIHTNAFDEALALPTARSARIALRTQQILANEAGGDRHGRPARRRLLHRGDDRRARGARAASCSSGSTSSAARSRRSSRSSSSARSRTRRSATSRRSSPASASSSASTATRRPRRRTWSCSASTRPRSSGSSSGRRACGPSATPRRREAALEEVRRVARGTEKLLPPMREALRVRGTVGEICGVAPRRVGNVRLAARLDVIVGRSPASGRRPPPSTQAVTSAAGVTSNARLSTSTPGGAIRVPASSATSSAARRSTGISAPVGVAGSSVDTGRRDVERDRVVRARAPPARRCRPCWRRRRWRRCGRRRRRPRRPRRPPSAPAAITSATSRNGMPSRASSHAVSRAPWSTGRVSSTQTLGSRPCSCAARITPIAVP